MSEENKTGNSEGNSGCDSAIQRQENHKQRSAIEKARTRNRIKKSTEITGHNSLIVALTIITFCLAIAINRQIPKPVQMLITAGAFLLAFKAESMYVKWTTGEEPVRSAIIYGVFGFLGIATAIATTL